MLQLLLRGRTNAQIAETLGITLDGAKWHVREIITKLGVDSREEAAEYWRAHNGLRLRFSRALRSLVPASAGLKVFAGGAGVVLIAGVAAAAVIALQQPGESIPAAASSATATPDQTVTPV
ncbi:MAG: helix-turn-helix transcriptional regulator, partial [Tepidiformaceae bacterium]